MAAADGGASMGMTPKIRFDVIGEAWKLFQQNMVPWIMAGLVPLVALLVGSVLAWLVMFVLAVKVSVIFMFLGIPVMIIVSILAGAYIACGLFNLALKQIRGEPIGIGEMFKGIPTSAVITAILVNLCIAVGGIVIIGGWVAGGLLLFAIPLAIDRRLAPIDALKQSFEALKPEALMAIVFFFVIQLVGGIGSILCGVGLLVTMPLMFLSIVLLYRDFFLSGGSSSGVNPPAPYTG